MCGPPTGAGDGNAASILVPVDGASEKALRCTTRLNSCPSKRICRQGEGHCPVEQSSHGTRSDLSDLILNLRTTKFR